MRSTFSRFVPTQPTHGLAAMREAGELVGRTLTAVKEAAAPGMSTLELNNLADDLIRAGGGIPNFLGYQGFTGSVCASVNDVVVHGIPRDDVLLAEGDLVTIDCGAIIDGWHADSALTFGIGELSEEDEKLNRATSDVLDAGVAAMVIGARLTDISHAMEQEMYAAAKRYNITLEMVDGFGGHAIGRKLHLDPFLPNEGEPGKGPRIRAGSVLCIEPIIALGTYETTTDADGWTVRTIDGSKASHWEHMVVATAAGPEIMTPRPR